MGTCLTIFGLWKDESKMSLFQLGDFVLHSGKLSRFKIDCESLKPEDWEMLAWMAANILPRFSTVEPVPKGGIPFAEALMKYRSSDTHALLICEDVITTGASMDRVRNGRDAFGVCVFARGVRCPKWVKPLFFLSDALVDL